ncbi:MAG: DUF2238 domain-containing protein [Saprospiraceae bacterium]|nr:DUF2238 domain-containing protein [Saprospiraceae bacterium]
MRFTIAISQDRTPIRRNYWIWCFITLFGILWANTLIGTTDLHNWVLENTLTIAFILILIFTFQKFQFSDLSYLLIFLYLCLHVYGSKYTYAENPLGFCLQDYFHASRNHYDRIVHFSFGFLLAYPMREMFLVGLKYPKLVAWILPIELTLSISGLYELVE